MKGWEGKAISTKYMVPTANATKLATGKLLYLSKKRYLNKNKVARRDLKLNFFCFFATILHTESFEENASFMVAINLSYAVI